MSSYFHEKIVKPLYSAFQQGLSSHAIALSFAVGMVVGIFPIPLTTMFICFGFIYVLELNVAICQVVNLLVTPVQLMMIVPFLRFGEMVLRLDPLPLTGEELSAQLEKSVLGAFSKFGFALGVASFGWCLFALISIPLIYIIIYAGLQRTQKSQARARSARNPHLGKEKGV
mmetsp:Transcript_29916/g.41350  ORF Transcript_29916/g.41350 Transcript_29916/m.41350 type:complete len:171 (+) Transcript_29916:1-513(+)